MCIVKKDVRICRRRLRDRRRHRVSRGQGAVAEAAQQVDDRSEEQREPDYQGVVGVDHSQS